MAGRLSALLDRFRPARIDPEDRERIEAWVRDALALTREDGVRISEIACMDADCQGLETVILIIRPKQRIRAVKCRGGAGALTRRDVSRALGLED